MSKLDDLVREIEREFGYAREHSSRLALGYLQRSYEEGWAVGTRDVRAVVGDVPLPRADPRRVQHVARHSFDSIRGIEDLGRERVRAIFKRATDDATMSVRDITKALEEGFLDEVEAYRLPLIARTETNRAGNAAKYDRYQASSVTHVQALTAEDSRVREMPEDPADHAAIHGQVRRIGQPFTIPRDPKRATTTNGNGDRYPPFDPNCRCTIVPFIPEGREKFAADKRLRDWKERVGAYARAMTLDTRREWRRAVERAQDAIRTRGPEALAEARSGLVV